MDAAKDALVTENMGLVGMVANKYKGYGVDYDDLFQAGCEGLIKAAEKFDVDRGFAFGTYAVPKITDAIQQELGRELRNSTDDEPTDADEPYEDEQGYDEAEIDELLEQARLSPMEMFCIVCHNGLDGGPEMPISQIARELSTTDYYVAKAIKAAQVKIKATYRDES